MSGAGKASVFSGLSTLRAEERSKQQQGPKPDSALQQYLQKYAGGGEGGAADGGKKKKKKKPAPPSATSQPAIKIIDQDVSGFVAVQQRDHRGAQEEVEEDEDEEDCE